MRFTNQEVLNNFDAVCEQIETFSLPLPMAAGGIAIANIRSPLTPLTKGGIQALLGLW